MATRRANPHRVKQHRSYSVQELAACLDVHKNTVRNWQQKGLHPIDKGRPVLFQGGDVRAFLKRFNADRKRPCPPGTLYCVRCREPRPPALDLAEFTPGRGDSGDLKAICGTCETIMHRRTRNTDLARVLPGIPVQITEGEPRLSGCTGPSLNCDNERQEKSW